MESLLGLADRTEEDWAVNQARLRHQQQQQQNQPGPSSNGIVEEGGNNADSDEVDEDDNDSTDGHKPLKVRKYGKPMPTLPTDLTYLQPQRVSTISTPSDRLVLQEKLKRKLEEARLARYRDMGITSGNVPLNRDAILNARRERQKHRKTEIRVRNGKKTDEEEVPVDKASIGFGRVKFETGNKLSTAKSTLQIGKRKSEESKNVTTKNLREAQAKKAKLAGMSEEERAAVIEKGKWDKALLLSQGGKVRDDEKKLKHKVKDREKQRSKSTTQWQERLAAVDHAKDARQRQRRENIDHRKEVKGTKGKVRQSLVSKFKTKKSEQHDAQSAARSKKRKSTGESSSTHDHESSPGKKIKRPGFEGKSKMNGIFKKSKA